MTPLQWAVIRLAVWFTLCFWTGAILAHLIQLALTR